ncbi:MAG: hypothetical protein WD431_25960 [Cyclobacteriaceae bacterium]
MKNDDAFFVALILQLMVIKIPLLGELLEFENLPILDFLVITLMASVILGAGQLCKYLRFKKDLF